MASGAAWAAMPGLDEATRRLFEAVQADDFSAVQASISAGADVEATDEWGMQPVDLAIDRGHYRIAHFLVSVRNARRASENAAKQQPTPLDRAAGSGLPPAAEPGKTNAKLPTGPAKSRGVPTRDGSQSGSLPATSTAGPAVSLPPPVAAWPADQPNPFDPREPALGSRLPVVNGESQ